MMVQVLDVLGMVVVVAVIVDLVRPGSRGPLLVAGVFDALTRAFAAAA